MVRINGRNQLDMTAQFPELVIPEAAFRATSALFDGEIVCLDADGKPNFQHVIQRMQQKTPGGIERARSRHPAICYLFDCLYLDGRPIVNEPLIRRREWLKDAVKTNPAYRLSEAMEDGPAFFAAVQQVGLEGIMAKQRQSAYLPGRRSDAWLKIKARQTVECIIIGYTRGKGDRTGSFGALHIAQATDPSKLKSGGRVLKYVGKVGSGFDDRSLKAVMAELDKLERGKRPIPEKPVDDARSIWLKPSLLCEVQFASRTNEGALREPVFLRLRPDLSG